MASRSCWVSSGRDVADKRMTFRLYTANLRASVRHQGTLSRWQWKESWNSSTKIWWTVFPRGNCMKLVIWSAHIPTGQNSALHSPSEHLSANMLHLNKYILCVARYILWMGVVDAVCLLQHIAHIALEARHEGDRQPEWFCPLPEERVLSKAGSYPCWFILRPTCFGRQSGPLCYCIQLLSAFLSCWWRPVNVSDSLLDVPVELWLLFI